MVMSRQNLHLQIWSIETSLVHFFAMHVTISAHQTLTICSHMEIKTFC